MDPLVCLSPMWMHHYDLWYLIPCPWGPCQMMSKNLHPISLLGGSGAFVHYYYFFWSEAASKHNTVSLCFVWDNFAVLFVPLMAVLVRKLALILVFSDSCLLFSCIDQLNSFWNVQVCWLSQRAEALCKNPECLLYEQTSVEFGLKLTVVFFPSTFSPWWASSSFIWWNNETYCLTLDDWMTPWSFECNSWTLDM